MTPYPPASPENDLSRPAYVDYLIHDFGEYLGLDGLCFDDDHQISLQIDDVSLGIEYLGEGTGLLFQSAIHLGDGAFGPEVYVHLNNLNAMLVRDGGGLLLAVPDSSSLLWIDRVRVEGLTVEMLDEALKRSVSRVKACTELAMEVLSHRDLDSAPESAQPQEMIRI